MRKYTYMQSTVSYEHFDHIWDNAWKLVSKRAENCWLKATDKWVKHTGNIVKSQESMGKTVR